MNKDKELTEELVCVKTYNNRIEAGFALGILESEGILSFISADDCGGVYSALSKICGGVKLLVKKEDLEIANDLLEGICEE